MGSVDPISPELVLVTPELAEQARAALPDRPWELFVPPPSPQRPLELVPLTPIRPTPAVTREPLVLRIAAIFPVALLVVFVAAVVVGTLPWIGDRPTLGPVPARTQPPPAQTTSTGNQTPGGAITPPQPRGSR